MVQVKATAGDELGVAWNPSTAGAKTEGGVKNQKGKQ